MSSSNSAPRTEMHRHFSVHCFNEAWSYFDKPDRSAEDDAMLLHLVHASMWHWLQREDCKSQNLSVGYWQVSRAYAVIGDAANAKRFGELCLKHSDKEPPFFLGYAHEALARAAKVAGDAATMKRHLTEAAKLALKVTEPDDRAMLEKDLAKIGA